MVPLSAVLIAQDEEKTIGDALASVAFCDEIVVVDSGSPDGTRAIAEAAGARVIVNAPWPGFVAQRDFATRAARHDWVLALDADERVGSGPARGDRGAATRGFDAAGYRIPRVAWYLGRWIRGTDWYPDWQVRLFDRTRGGWQGDLVHESVTVRGPRGAPPRASSSTTPTPTSPTTCARSTPTRRCGPGRPTRPGAARTSSTCSAGASWAFFRNYVLKRGFLLGSTGLIVSVLNTHYTFAKLAKLRELDRAVAPRDEPAASSTWTPPPPGAAGRTRCCSPRGAWPRAGWRRRSPAAPAASSRPVRARPGPGCGRCPSAATSGRPRSSPSPASCAGSGRTPCCSTTRTRSRPALVASRLAGRVALVAVRRVDFPLRGPFSRAKYAACDRVIVVSRAIGSVVEAGGVQAERLRLVYEGVPDRVAGGGRPRGARRRSGCRPAFPSSATWPR